MVKVAAAQIPVTKNALTNLNKIIQYIKKAASKNIDIVCFPETSLIHSKNKNSIKKIQFNNYLKKIKRACEEGKIHCIFGTNILKNNKLYNSAFLIDDKGKIAYRYDKVNLFIKEKNKKKTFAGKNNRIIKVVEGDINVRYQY